MTLKTSNTLDMADAPPAKAGTPNLLKALGQLEAEIRRGMRYGVPPSGGGAYANTMTLKTSNTLDMADAPPAKAGTPNLLKALGQLEAEIQQGMKELEGMLK